MTMNTRGRPKGLNQDQHTLFHWVKTAYGAGRSWTEMLLEFQKRGWSEERIGDAWRHLHAKGLIEPRTKEGTE